ncbi:unnamed protein product [Spirodela intermedia]|uniref:MADS-box domain-containing protein n=1 Tax=Spirodela intermedia TaxID=51605 RepID=A0A7I8K4D7_SPIIN|nr:unnamed protein product [Spirodela intermedia]
MARAPRRVHVERILRSAPRQVSFSKRRQGLFKKVCELSALCGTESAVLVKSPGNKLYSLGEPDVDTVVDRFLDFVDRRGPAQEARPGAGEPAGAAMVAGGGQRRQQDRRPVREQDPRRIVVEELYRVLQLQDTWLEAADARLEELRADIREKQAQLPHRWAAKVEDLEPAEAAEMIDALQVLSLRVSQVLEARQMQEGPLPGQASSSSYPPSPSNPWDLPHGSRVSQVLAARQMQEGPLPGQASSSSYPPSPSNPWDLPHGSRVSQVLAARQMQEGPLPGQASSSSYPPSPSNPWDLPHGSRVSQVLAARQMQEGPLPGQASSSSYPPSPSNPWDLPHGSRVSQVLAARQMQEGPLPGQTSSSSYPPPPSNPWDLPHGSRVSQVLAARQVQEGPLPGQASSSSYPPPPSNPWDLPHGSRVSQVLAARQVQEGPPSGQASSSSYPPPPPSNPWDLPYGSMAVGAAPMPAMDVFQPPPFGPSTSTGHLFPWLDDDPTGGAFMAGGSQLFGQIPPSTVFQQLGDMGAGSSSGYLALPPPPLPPPPLFGIPYPSRRDGEGPSSGSGPPNLY